MFLWLCRDSSSNLISLSQRKEQCLRFPHAFLKDSHFHYYNHLLSFCLTIFKRPFDFMLSSNGIESQYLRCFGFSEPVLRRFDTMPYGIPTAAYPPINIPRSSCNPLHPFPNLAPLDHGILASINSAGDSSTSPPAVL
jgi:hypothetical protein